MKTSWTRHLLTIADLGIYSREQVLNLDPAMVAERKRKLGFNMEHLNCSDVYGGERGVFFFQTGIAEEIPRDFIGEYLPEAHSRGIRVLIYYNVHWLDRDFGMRNPDWLQVSRDGRTKEDLYGSGCAPCVNSGWREWSFRGIRDLADYDIDGIFLDGPIFISDGCYCESCRESFRNEYGTTLPREQKRDDPTWRQFLDFRYESIARYMEDASRNLKEIRPDAVIYMNSSGVSPSWPAARDNRRLLTHQDILGAEGGFLYHDLRTSPLWKPGMCAKLLETQAGGKPTVVFLAGANKGWDDYLLTPAETRLLFADTVANGANPWYGIPFNRSDRLSAQAAGEMNRFLQEFSEYFEGTRPLSKIALLWSTRTADFYKATVPFTDFTPDGDKMEREGAGDFSSSFRGCYESLVRSHLPFEVLDEIALRNGSLDRYDLLITPNCACLSGESCDCIERYVYRGGNLLASFETSLYNQNGSRLENFGLSRVLGVDTGRGKFGPMKIDYMALTENHPLFEGLTDDNLPCPIYGMEVMPNTSKPLAKFREKMKSRYSKLPPISDLSAITLNSYGKGKALYLSGNFFEHYENYHNPDYRLFMSNAARSLSSPLVHLQNCPTSVEITMRTREPDTLLIHLVNFTGEMTRPIESVTPVHDVEVKLNGFHNLKSARSISPSRPSRDLEPLGNNQLKLDLESEYKMVIMEK